MSVEAEMFAFGSSLYGGRPTFALTRSMNDGGAEVTLYELLPNDLAEGRSERFERSQQKSMSRVPLDSALVEEISHEMDAQTALSNVGTATKTNLSEWRWDDWCAIKVTTLRLKQLRAIGSLIRVTLEDAGIEPDYVLSGEEGSVLLPECDGIRLALAFLGMKRLYRYDKLTTFADGIKRMSVEECYYWHAKCRSPSSPNGVKALRVLLTDHVD